MRANEDYHATSGRQQQLRFRKNPPVSCQTRFQQEVKDQASKASSSTIKGPDYMLRRQDGTHVAVAEAVHQRAILCQGLVLRTKPAKKYLHGPWRQRRARLTLSSNISCAHTKHAKPRVSAAPGVPGAPIIVLTTRGAASSTSRSLKPRCEAACTASTSSILPALREHRQGADGQSAAGLRRGACLSRYLPCLGGCCTTTKMITHSSVGHECFHRVHQPGCLHSFEAVPRSIPS